MRKITYFKIFLVLAIMLFVTPSAVFAAEKNEFHYQGISFQLLDSFEQIETDYEDIGATIQGPSTTIKVFIQQLGSQLSVESYIEYGIIPLVQKKAGFQIISKKKGKLGNLNIWDITYSRPAINNILHDQNYYREIHIIDKVNKKVITIWSKTANDTISVLNNAIQTILSSFKRTKYIDKYSFIPLEAETKHIKYSGKGLTLEIPKDKKIWGRFYPGVPFNPAGYQRMLDSEKELGHKFEFIMTYQFFPSNDPFPYQAIKKVYQDGRVLMLTLQPFTPDLNWIAVPEIIDGQHDHIIKEWALALKEIGEPVFLRPLNEMNGDWDPWCAWFFGKDTDLYIQAWRHMVDIFRENGAHNVLFVWNPHDRSYPNFQWNNSHLYYPGDEYVDWVGLTGYNNGTSHPHDIWREFNEIYQPLYQDYLKRYHSKPFMITEFSSNEVGGNKAQWIADAFTSLNSGYDNIKIINWFDQRDNLWLYQIDSTPGAQASFAKGLAGEGFIKNGIRRH